MIKRAIPIESVFDGYAGIPVLVLGSSGFIGRWVARLLTSAGARLYLPVRACSSAKQTFTSFGVSGEILKLDLLDTDRTARMINEIEPAITFNLAGYGVDRSETCEELAIAINAQLPATICTAVAATHSSWSGPRVVHAGTAMEYGAISGDLREDSPTRPTSLYGRSKLAGTENLAATCRRTSLAGITARLFSVYGPGESDERLLPSLMAKAGDTNAIPLTAGVHKRDFTYVQDIAEALLRLGLAECRPGEVVNVATGALTPVQTFIRTAAEHLGILEDRLDFGALTTRPEEMDHDPVNCDRLSELTGWKPPTDLREGIRRSIAFGQSSRAVATLN